MNKAEMARAFNEWMRRYTEDPKAFDAEFQTVSEYLAERAAGEQPTYGDICAEWLAKLASETAEAGAAA